MPEGNPAIQMMENLLSPLKSLNPTWLSPGSTTFAMDMVLAFVCGVGLFLLLLPWLPGEPPLLPSRKNRNIRKVRNLTPDPAENDSLSFYQFPLLHIKQTDF